MVGLTSAFLHIVSFTHIQTRAMLQVIPLNISYNEDDERIGSGTCRLWKALVRTLHPASIYCSTITATILQGLSATSLDGIFQTSTSSWNVKRKPRERKGRDADVLLRTTGKSLVDWNVEILAKSIREIIERRNSKKSKKLSCWKWTLW